jgi:pyrroline-5-carboxylate reductase
MKSIGFVGAGRIARIMIEGWTRAGRLPGSIALHDTDSGKVDEIVARFPAVKSGDLAAVSAQDIVVLGLHPPAAVETLPKMTPSLRRDGVLLSLAPKLRFARLRELAGGFGRIARQNPNAPSIIGHGFNPIAFAPDLDAAARRDLHDLLAPLGQTPEVAEETIEAYALISAMGPTYLWFQLQLLQDLGRQFGLSETAARQAVAQMVHGAATTLFEAGLSSETVLDLVPVKPLSGDETAIAAIYRSRLEPLYAKLTL